MLAIFIKRILLAIPVIIAVASITFFLVKLAPGSPFDGDKKLAPQVIKNLENHYCEMTKFDDKIVIRCLADDNYDLKKTLNFIMKNVINDKLPKSWDL